jgi:hypothetical protein
MWAATRKTAIVETFESPGSQRVGRCAIQGFGICALPRVLIPVMWALDSGDVGRRRSEATLVVS